jgi:hypothetical protein
MKVGGRCLVVFGLVCVSTVVNSLVVAPLPKLDLFDYSAASGFLLLQYYCSRVLHIDSFLICSITDEGFLGFFIDSFLICGSDRIERLKGFDVSLIPSLFTMMQLWSPKVE